MLVSSISSKGSKNKEKSEVCQNGSFYFLPKFDKKVNLITRKLVSKKYFLRRKIFNHRLKEL
jgi:hypothetical protein